MRIAVLVLLIFCFIKVSAQKQTKAQRAFEAAEQLYNTKQPEKALESFEAFLERYTWSSLAPRAHYNIGYISYELHDYKKARTVFNQILRAEYDERDKNSLMEPYALYKHRSARLLAEMSLQEKRWDDAESYIKTYNKEYPYQHFCGNEWEAYDIFNATMDARLQEGRGNINKAIADLLPYIFGNLLASTDNAVETMKDILKRNYNEQQLSAELNAAIENIRTEKKGEDSMFFLSLFGNEINLSNYMIIPETWEAPKTIEETRKEVRKSGVFVAFLGN